MGDSGRKERFNVVLSLSQSQEMNSFFVCVYLLTKLKAEICRNEIGYWIESLSQKEVDSEKGKRKWSY